MTCRQNDRMVRHESIVTALIGSCLGLPLGIIIAAVITRALRGAVAYSLPVVSLIVLGLVAVAAGVIAAALPARRASRLNLLRALQYE
jgi:putative ABC transport system permease protein